MKWQRIIFFFFIPSLVYSFNEKEAKDVRAQAFSQWNQHIEFLKDYKNFEADEQGRDLQCLRESLSCCKRSLLLINKILSDIKSKPKKKRKRRWRVHMKRACKKDQQTIKNEMITLEQAIDQILSSTAFNKALTFYEDSLKIATQASQKRKESPPHTLINHDAVIAHFNETAGLYRQAKSLAKEAYQTLVAAPFYEEANKTALEQTIENYEQAAHFLEQEAEEWPKKALAQKMSLKKRLDMLTEDCKLFEEKGLRRSSYELHKQALPILKTLVKNSEGEEKEGFEERIKEVKALITHFEKKSDQNKFTPAMPPFSAEYKLQEKARRESFFKSNDALDPNFFLQPFIYPSVIPLDGQRGTSPGEYAVYLDQFYRFYLKSNDPITKLVVRVYDQNNLVHEEEMSLPIKNTLSWQSYLLTEGLVFVPKTQLEKNFGLNLRLMFVKDPRCHTSLVISQKAGDSRYQFSFALNDGTPLYVCNPLEPPPWQLNTLRKPSMSTPPYRFTQKSTYASIRDTKTLPEIGLNDHFLLLDEFVQECKEDPLALAAYVQNEIALVDAYCHQKEDVFQASGIRRNALRVYLEKQGSPWEQCQLLVYLLKSAGFQAFYAMGKPCRLPKNFVEKMLFTRLPEGQEEGLLQYPWVVFFDGEKWISLFPWMKEIQMSEGFNVYHFLPEEFASADRWILHYLKGDERILKHIGSDGDDSAARLFVAFVGEHLRQQGLSLEDVGIHRTQIKRQLTSFTEFPSPKIDGPFTIFNLDKSSEFFATARIEIASHENPEKKINAVIPLISVTSQAIPLRFEGDL